jgi:predicted XRE-type DNA-binding protein
MRWDAHKATEPAIAQALHQFADAGVFAASKALHRSTRTLNRIALEHGVEFSTSTARTMKARRQNRASMVTQIKALAGTRSQAEICTALGITRAVVRELAEIHNININSRSKGS